MDEKIAEFFGVPKDALVKHEGPYTYRAKMDLPAAVFDLPPRACGHRLFTDAPEWARARLPCADPRCGQADTYAVVHQEFLFATSHSALPIATTPMRKLHLHRQRMVGPAGDRWTAWGWTLHP